MAQITLTLTKSPISRIPAQRRTVKALGLGKLGSSVVKEDTPANRAMAASVAHLVTVTEGGEKAVKAKKVAADKKVETSETASVAKPNSASKVAEIKAYLDSKNIKYASTAKKAELLELVK